MSTFSPRLVEASGLTTQESSPTGRLLRWLASIHRRSLERHHIEMSVQRLRELDNHLLRDIGVEPSNIERQVRGRRPAPTT
ncbi:DUF1127 domain-containing protein [Rubellimicrobium arenae]|uniref:DUF1127 domain-containing protein n=1 Tax=Rubellimicrobium arenae TaxID=2817372 RepID=UPI001B31351F|nr:DUF1127 domain-containing protein [Rubellimicrobium arenae]